jgi:hypothetical protein
MVPIKLDNIINFVKKNKMSHVRIYVIAQGSNTAEIVRINFYKTRKDVQEHDITFGGGRSIGPISTNVWSEVHSPLEISELLSNQDVLWIEKSDELIDNILSKITDASTCQKPLNEYFLIKAANGKFECRLLQNPFS